MSIIIDGTYATPAVLGAGRSGGYSRLTFADAYDIGAAFLRGHGAEASSEVRCRAVQEAFIDIINAYDWLSLEGAGRIHLYSTETDGTVTYTHDTRRLVLDGSTWPSWVLNGSILLDEVICEVESYINSTTIVLHESLNPGADLAAGTSYRLFCRWYPLPADFVNFTGPIGRNTWAYGQKISMTELAAYQRNYSESTGPSRYYAIGEQPNAPTEKAIYLWPFATQDEPLDFTYNRRPREPQYSGRDAADMAGTITVSEGSNAVTGSSTLFEDQMAGALLLIGRNGTSVPTGRYGLNRFAEQHRIHSVTSATALALTANVTQSLEAVKYLITDPIDVETCAQNAFLRYMEMHLAQSQGLDMGPHGHTANYIGLAEKALREAMAASYPHRYDPTQDLPSYVSPWEGAVDYGEA